MVKIIRNIVKIDKEKCTGCGNCIIKCAEGALKIINGKAEIISDEYCDGLGACLGECPEGAISIELREAEDFNEEAVEEYLKRTSTEKIIHNEENEHVCEHYDGEEIASCISTKFRALFEANETTVKEKVKWPIKIELIHPKAQFADCEEIILVADCVPVIYENFHATNSSGHPIIITCPKFTDNDLIMNRIGEILENSALKNVKIIQMDVPCCSKLKSMIKQILTSLNKSDIVVNHEVISLNGEKIAEGGV
ncbi:MAG: ATP-binding protein [Candidatus Helarchaeota archaeon]